jgi:hypothetical protein
MVRIIRIIGTLTITLGYKTRTITIYKTILPDLALIDPTTALNLSRASSGSRDSTIHPKANHRGNFIVHGFTPTLMLNTHLRKNLLIPSGFRSKTKVNRR